MDNILFFKLYRIYCLFIIVLYLNIIQLSEKILKKFSTWVFSSFGKYRNISLKAIYSIHFIIVGNNDYRILISSENVLKHEYY